MNSDDLSPRQSEPAPPISKRMPIEQPEAERLLMGKETLDDRLDTLSQASPEIRFLSAEIPRTEWEQHLGRELAIPPQFSDQVAGDLPMTADDVAMIEKSVEAAHGITPPFGAALEIPAEGPAVAYLTHDEKGWFAR